MSWCPVLSESQDRVLCWSGWQSQTSVWPLSSGIWAPSSLLVSPGGQSLHREKDSVLKGWGWQPRTWACCLMARASPVILRLPSLFPSLSSWMLVELAHWSQKITAGCNPEVNRSRPCPQPLFYRSSQQPPEEGLQPSFLESRFLSDLLGCLLCVWLKASQGHSPLSGEMGWEQGPASVELGRPGLLHVRSGTSRREIWMEILRNRGDSFGEDVKL